MKATFVAVVFAVAIFIFYFSMAPDLKEGELEQEVEENEVAVLDGDKLVTNVEAGPPLLQRRPEGVTAKSLGIELEKLCARQMIDGLNIKTANPNYRWHHAPLALEYVKAEALEKLPTELARIEQRNQTPITATELEYATQGLLIDNDKVGLPPVFEGVGVELFEGLEPALFDKLRTHTSFVRGTFQNSRKLDEEEWFDDYMLKFAKHLGGRSLSPAMIFQIEGRNPSKLPISEASAIFWENAIARSSLMVKIDPYFLSMSSVAMSLGIPAADIKVEDIGLVFPEKAYLVEELAALDNNYFAAVSNLY